MNLCPLMLIHPDANLTLCKCREKDCAWWIDALKGYGCCAIVEIIDQLKYMRR